MLALRYLDEQDELRRIDIPDRFDLPVRAIHDLLQSLNHDLVGRWQSSYGDATIQFNRDSGTFTGYDGQDLPFHWREIDGGALEIVPLSDSVDGLQTGLYHFELSPKGSSFELTFLEGFGGTSVRRLERTDKSSEAALDPARVAARPRCERAFAQVAPSCLATWLNLIT